MGMNKGNLISGVFVVDCLVFLSSLLKKSGFDFSSQAFAQAFFDKMGIAGDGCDGFEEDCNKKYSVGNEASLSFYLESSWSKLYRHCEDFNDILKDDKFFTPRL